MGIYDKIYYCKNPNKNVRCNKTICYDTWKATKLCRSCAGSNKIIKKLTKEFLEEQYKTKTPIEIASIIGCSRKTIMNYLKRYDIKIRNISEGAKFGIDAYWKKQSTKKANILTREFLETQYKTKSITEIQDITGYGRNSIKTYLKKYGIKLRNMYEVNKLAKTDESKMKASRTSKGKHYSRKSEFKKGRKYNLNITKNTICKHHKYLKENSSVIIELSSTKHFKIHTKAYEYLYEIYGKEGIDKYVEWFDKKYKLK